MPDFEFCLTEDRQSLCLLVSSESVNPITADDVIEAFRTSEFSALHLDETLLRSLFDPSTPTPTSDNDEAPPPVIAQRLDACLEIKVSEDAMSAAARITGPWGGRKIKAQQILIAASKEGINHGLDMAKITALASDSRQAPPGTVLEREIAVGTPAVDGVDGYLEKIAWTLKDRILAPQKTGDGTGTVDMRNLGPIISCKPDEPLMRRHPPQPGEFGQDVLGRAIEFQAGADPRINVAEGTRISQEDPDLLIASRKGLPRLLEDGMTVDEVLELKRIDLSSGDIEYDGSILIAENIIEDMSVKANGDISVGGIIESSQVEASGDIFVANGVIGRQLKGDNARHSVRLKAGGDIHAKYAQNADLHAAGEIVMKEYLFNSTTEAGSSIWVGRHGNADGHLMGGRACAGRNITAGYVGAESGSAAQLELAPQLIPLRDEIRTLGSELLSHEERMLQLRVAMRSLIKANKKDALTQAKAMVLTQQQKVNECDSRLRARQAEYDSLLKEAALVAHHNLYSLIQIKLLNQKVVSRREHGPVKVTLKDSELQIIPLEK